MTSSRHAMDTLARLKDTLQHRFKVKSIHVFGSVARGEETPRSDLDILVEFSEPVGFLHFLRLEKFLEEFLGVKIDLVSRKDLKPHIDRNIMTHFLHSALKICSQDQATGDGQKFRYDTPHRPLLIRVHLLGAFLRFNF